MEIEIRVGRRWKEEGGEEKLAKRIARIISFDDAACEENKREGGGYKWSLDYRGNDWWMSGIENGIVKVAYRYGHGHKAMMEGLRTFLQWEVGQSED